MTHKIRIANVEAHVTSKSDYGPIGPYRFAFASSSLSRYRFFSGTAANVTRPRLTAVLKQGLTGRASLEYFNR